jgi:hypothetical protein
MNMTAVGTATPPGSPVPQNETVAFSPDGTNSAVSSYDPLWVWTPSGIRFAATGGTPANFVKIGHTFIALLLAWVGGILSRRLYHPSATVMGVH